MLLLLLRAFFVHFFVAYVKRASGCERVCAGGRAEVHACAQVDAGVLLSLSARLIAVAKAVGPRPPPVSNTRRKVRSRWKARRLHKPSTKVSLEAVRFCLGLPRRHAGRRPRVPDRRGSSDTLALATAVLVVRGGDPCRGPGEASRCCQLYGFVHGRERSEKRTCQDIARLAGDPVDR